MIQNEIGGGALAGANPLNSADPTKINAEHSHLSELRKRHLSEVFDLPGDVASVLAELAFGLEGAR